MIDEGATREGFRGSGTISPRRKGGDLVYAGNVDHAFDKSSVADPQKRLKPLIRKTQPYARRIAHKSIWVEPKLLAEIEYRAKSAEGKVRHPFFKGLREDRSPLRSLYVPQAICSGLIGESAVQLVQ
ncbi:bifunctional non-homologous end joining protein LigD [Bradyrhizobium huanghuaihaiense]|uniref:DNA ligase (ATP) n=1 Tax=Bradyrhizobium huanghuaihaiense TaxID=990078 RepID=A0A562QX21_9BRAD|nr:bifunctional non-homologous end joining protein LigD [Bradyrhizobium huanghuaihaiense]